MEKTEIPGLYKEREGILINKDDEGLLAYKKKKLKAQRLEVLDQEVSELKNEIKEIKDLLLKVLNK